jgi:hypothetical protein
MITDPQQVRKFSTFHETLVVISSQEPITVHILGQMNPPETFQSYSFTYCSPNGPFLAGFPTKTLFEFVFSLIPATFHNHPILPEVIICIISGKYRGADKSLA